MDGVSLAPMNRAKPSSGPVRVFSSLSDPIFVTRAASSVSQAGRFSLRLLSINLSFPRSVSRCLEGRKYKHLFLQSRQIFVRASRVLVWLLLVEVASSCKE